VIVNAAGINLRSMQIADLNPRTWVFRASRAGHLMYAHAEKFYYDLRVVYEVESRFRELRGQPQDQEEAPPKPEPPTGGSSQDVGTGESQVASATDLKIEGVTAAVMIQPGPGGTGRSLNP
jgi:hypothetical protein